MGEAMDALGIAPAKPITPRHVAMCWAQRLKRVFGIDIETCTGCGGKLKVIASIEEPGGASAPDPETDLRRRSGSGTGLLALGAEQAGIEGDAGVPSRSQVTGSVR